MTESMSQCHQQSVVGHMLIFQGSPHVEVEPIADHHERDIIERMRIALTQLIAPQDQRIIQQRSVASRFRSFGEPTYEIRQLLTVPGVNLGQLLVSILVFIGLMRKFVVAFIDSQPAVSFSNRQSAIIELVRLTLAAPG